MTELLPLNTAPLPVKLRVDDYLLLDGSGAFEAYRKTELIEGDVFYMNAQHRPHARVKSRLFAAIFLALRGWDGLEAIVEGSIAMPPHNVPEPDIVITREPDGSGLIPLASVALIVEVSDTTLDGDLGRKQAIYAVASVPEYWVVDVNRNLVHQMWSPTGEAYAEKREVSLGSTIASTTIRGLAVETAAI